MKAYGNVFISHSSLDSISVEDFLKTDHVKTPAGKLFLALLEETTWSKDFEVYLNIAKKKVGVMSPLLPNQGGYHEIFFVETNEKLPTVEEVLGAIVEATDSRAQSLMTKAEELVGMVRKINLEVSAILQNAGKEVIRKRLKRVTVGDLKFKCLRGLVWGKEKTGVTYFVKTEELTTSSNPPVYQLTGEASEFFEDHIHTLLTPRDKAIEGAVLVE